MWGGEGVRDASQSRAGAEAGAGTEAAAPFFTGLRGCRLQPFLYGYAYLYVVR